MSIPSIFELVVLLTADGMRLQHKMKNIVWVGTASGLDGEFQSGSDIDFYVDKVGALVHVALRRCSESTADNAG